MVRVCVTQYVKGCEIGQENLKSNGQVEYHMIEYEYRGCSLASWALLFKTRSSNAQIFMTFGRAFAFLQKDHGFDSSVLKTLTKSKIKDENIRIL